MIRLRAERKRQDLTQAELANQAGITPSDVSKVETDLKKGNEVLCPGHLKKISDVLEINPENAGEEVEVEFSIISD